MVKVSVVYPNTPGTRFDVDYYLNVHMPMSARLLRPAVRDISVEIGMHGATPTEPSPFHAIAGFTCESVEAFTQAFLPHAAQLQGDIPKYTDVAPVIQISRMAEFEDPHSVHAHETISG